MGPPSCQACGLLLRDESRFCDGCGTRIAGPAIAEYKQVTVMFADVVRSMDIAGSVGAERLREIMGELLHRSTEVVRRYGGTVNQFTGDGLMAVFGVPNALEDHALRACRAALDVRDEVRDFASELASRDGVRLQIRIGLNSGQVIAGEIGADSVGYTTIGEQVGLAQRMESIAPAGQVMVSAATARLVEPDTVLGSAELVTVKGRTTPMVARLLKRVVAEHSPRDIRGEPPLVGRREELETVTAMLDRVRTTGGMAARVVGPAGIGKTRIVNEVAEIADGRSIPVYTTYCEAHTQGVAYRAVSRLLRSVFTITGTAPTVARAQVRSRLAGSDPGDLLLLDDLLGIGDPSVLAPDVSAEARQRRIAQLINDVVFAPRTSALYVIEDAHWIDEASESLLLQLSKGLAPTHSIMLITHRPDYDGALARAVDAEAVVLAALPDRDIVKLANQLLGSDPSVRRFTDRILETSSGNPYFITEIVRDLAERGILDGNHGQYRCDAEPTEDLSVPPTLQAAIAARIDRVAGKAKSVLYAAAVIGTRFSPSLLAAVLGDIECRDAVAELHDADLVDYIGSGEAAEYGFRHPLIRTVAYESQLRAARREMHRRVARALEIGAGAESDRDATMIAEHLFAAGDFRSAFDWYMLAGRWLINRDRVGAWNNWQRAREAAAALPHDQPERTALQIEVLTRLCGECWKTGGDLLDAGFDQLRQLCELTGDNRSLAIGMAGMVMALTGQHRHDEAVTLTAELSLLIDSLGDPSLECGLLLALSYAKSEIGQLRDALGITQKVIELTEGDPTQGGVLFGSPSASATRMRGLYRLCLGVRGWRADADAAIALARDMDPVSRVSAVMYKYILSVPVGARRVDEAARRETAEALRIAEKAGDHLTLALAQIGRGLVLVYGDDPGEEGTAMLAEARKSALERGFTMNAVSLIDPALARRKARQGDHSGAIDLARSAIAVMSERREVLSVGVATTSLVESLMERRADGDECEAEAALDDLAALRADEGFILHELPLLRLRAMLARTRGDESGAAEYTDRYRALAASAEFDIQG